MLGAVALVSLAAYLITPETAAGPAGDPVGFAFNLRYLGPALTLSLAVAPLALPLSDAPAAHTATVIGLAVIMAANVWFVIWPNQKKVLGLGVEADAEAKKKAGRIAMLASRTNTMLSIPMLFCMVGQKLL